MTDEATPLTEEEERHLRSVLFTVHVNRRGPWSDNDVERLLATLDVARDSRPVGEGLDVERLKEAGRNIWPPYESAGSSEDDTSSVDHSMERLAAEYARLATCSRP